MTPAAVRQPIALPRSRAACNDTQPWAMNSSGLIQPVQEEQEAARLAKRVYKGCGQVHVCAQAGSADVVHFVPETARMRPRGTQILPHVSRGYLQEPCHDI